MRFDDWFHFVVYEQLDLAILMLTNSFEDVLKSRFDALKSTCGMSNIFLRNTLLISGSIRCCVQCVWVLIIVLLYILIVLMGTCWLLTFMYSMDMSKAMYLLINGCVL